MIWTSSPYTTVYPPPTPQCTPPLHHSVPKEEEIKNNKEEEEDNYKGPNWDDFNLSGNGEGEPKEVIKVESANGKLSPGAAVANGNGHTPPADVPAPPPQPEPKKKGRGKKPIEPITFNLPDSINTPQVLQLLNDFCDNRREIGKPMTQRGANMLITSISDLGVPEIVVRIRTAITRNWLGVRFPGDDWQYAQYRNGGNGNGRAYQTNGVTTKPNGQTATAAWKPGGKY